MDSKLNNDERSATFRAVIRTVNDDFGKSTITLDGSPALYNKSSTL